MRNSAARERQREEGVGGTLLLPVPHAPDRMSVNQQNLTTMFEKLEQCSRAGGESSHSFETSVLVAIPDYERGRGRAVQSIVQRTADAPI